MLTYAACCCTAYCQSKAAQSNGYKPTFLPIVGCRAEHLAAQHLAGHLSCCRDTRMVVPYQDAGGCLATCRRRQSATIHFLEGQYIACYDDFVAVQKAAYLNVRPCPEERVKQILHLRRLPMLQVCSRFAHHGAVTSVKHHYLVMGHAPERDLPTTGPLMACLHPCDRGNANLVQLHATQAALTGPSNAMPPPDMEANTGMDHVFQLGQPFVNRLLHPWLVLPCLVRTNSLVSIVPLPSACTHGGHGELLGRSLPS